MRHLRVWAVALALGGCAAGESEMQYSGDVRVSSPELVAISPDVQVVADADEPLFYADGYYWLYRDNTWLRSDSYRGGFARVDVNIVPMHVRTIQQPQTYAHYRRNGGRAYARGAQTQTRAQPRPQGTEQYPQQQQPQQPMQQQPEPNRTPDQTPIEQRPLDQRPMQNQIPPRPAEPGSTPTEPTPSAPTQKPPVPNPMPDQSATPNSPSSDLPSTRKDDRQKAEPNDMKSDRADKPKVDNSDRIDHTERDKTEKKSDQPDKTDKTDKTDKSKKDKARDYGE